MKYYLNLSSMFLISIMTTNKLLLLQYPLRFGTTTSRKANLFCLTCWLVAFTFPAAGLLVDSQDVHFSYRSYHCSYGYSTRADILQWLIPILTSLPLISTCQVVGTTICLLIKAKQCAQRCQDSLKWQGIMATVLTATVYCISVLPYTVYSAGQMMVDESESFFFTSFVRIGISCLALNTISNFYIYCLTVLSFREFVRSRIELTWEYFSTKLFSDS